MQREDYDSIDRALDTLRREGLGRAHSLNEVMDAWRDLVEEVEAGYSASVYEYSHDASCRHHLDRIWAILSPAVRTARQDELDALDARFRAATEPSTALAGREGWWWRRVPILREGEFSEDIARREALPGPAQ